VLEADVMAEFKAQHGQDGWRRLIAAFRPDDPEEALRPASPPPPPGPLAATIYPYAELRRSLGLNGDATRNTLLDLDRFAQARGVTSPGAASLRGGVVRAVNQKPRLRFVALRGV
jgi:hypothetical protein